jgi:hypothetical protein
MSKKSLIAALLALLIGLTPIADVHAGRTAVRGMPGSGEFAYGAGITPEGLYVNEALEMAGNLPLDWLAVDLSWSSYAPEQASQPDWSHLDSLIQAASNRGISVLISLTGAPAWAMTPQGPSSAETVALINTLVSRYSPAVKAIELFPAANTAAGWGAQPDPQAYTALVADVAENLAGTGADITLVTGGLKPTTGSDSEDDLAFLDGLYNAGISNWSQVISLQLDNLTGDPAQAPSTEEHRVLRHYEEIRKVMLNYGRETDLIWLTSLQAPTGQSYSGVQAQSDWLVQAYTQLRSQLYIGAAFYSHINPEQSGSSDVSTGRALVISIDCYHLFYNMLRELIAQNAPLATISLRGRPKDGSIIKSRP